MPVSFVVVRVEDIIGCWLFDCDCTKAKRRLARTIPFRRVQVQQCLFNEVLKISIVTTVGILCASGFLQIAIIKNMRWELSKKQQFKLFLSFLENSTDRKVTIYSLCFAMSMNVGTLHRYFKVKIHIKLKIIKHKESLYSPTISTSLKPYLYRILLTSRIVFLSAPIGA